MIKLFRSPDCDGNCSGCASAGNCESAIRKETQNRKSNIKKIIGVVSGKGGVGKSFVTSLMASYLNKEGYRVGILDGDIVGPSIPKGFGIHGRAYGDEDRFIVPIETKTGIKIVSSNMLLEHEEDPIIWRGSLISSLLKQFFTEVAWGELDYLFIDMPPGTGDVTLTAFQSLPIDGIVIVTSPQDLVSLIVKKAVNMAKMMNIEILGVVENMSYVECSKCGEHIEVFGHSKLDEFAAETGLDSLARLPLKEGTTEKVDKGNIELVQMDEILPVIETIKNL